MVYIIILMMVLGCIWCFLIVFWLKCGCVFWKVGVVRLRNVGKVCVRWWCGLVVFLIVIFVNCINLGLSLVSVRLSGLMSLLLWNG